MLLRKITCCLYVFFMVPLVFAQVRDIQVPEEMEFAGVQLIIDDYARAKIKEFAQKLIRSESHFTILRERAFRFFPLMEKILDEEKVPDDFKFLAVQESALLADAVSTSNAVGYWQFKKPTALEMGMLVDESVDERKNIVAATKAAARYLRRNQVFTKNWVHTLLSYNLGLTGVRNTIKEGEIGASRMEIDGNTHWYIIRCLAHKIIFEDELRKRPETTIRLLVHPQANGMTLQEIADEMNVPLETMKLYNKWLLCSRIPEGRTYAVVIPVDFASIPVVSTKIKTTPQKIAQEKQVVADLPALETPPADTKPVFKVVNNKKVILANTGDTEQKLAAVADLRFRKFSKYNDLTHKGIEKTQPGFFYYLQKKDKKADIKFHIVQAGESLWQISQRYDIRYASLLKLNRMADNEKIQPGRVLYLQERRPKDEPVKIEKIQTAKKPAPNPTPVITKETDPKPAEIKAQPIKTEPDKSPVIAKTETQPIQKSTEVPDKQVTTPQTTYKTHQVLAKESLFSIARQYGVSVAALRYWNNLTDTEGLQPGQELLVSDPLGKPETNKKTPLPDTTSVVTTKADTTQVVKTAPLRQFALQELTEHIVQPGESLFRIAWEFGMTVPEIMDVNKKTESKIVPGEKLKVKAKK